ncbi:MAG: MobF family relaxase [Limisphaerales bacterium]
MFTARPQKSVQVAKEYFRKHLANGEYHSQGQTVVGRWFGKGLARLGLEPGSAVDQQAYERLCDNQHPLTGEKLTVRQREVDRRVYHDFTCAPPKSVSLAALTLGDERLVAAHEAAAEATMALMEKEAGTRLRRQGMNDTRVTGEIVAARFTHGESRALDPHLHTHYVVFNATWDPVENRWKALQTERIFEWMTYFTEVYRNDLARRVQDIGYAIRPSEHGFELAFVSEELVTRYSKRRRAILEEEARLEKKLGAPLSNNARATVAHTSRDRKNHDLTPEDFQRLQLQQLTPEELATLRQAIPGRNAAAVPKPEVSVDAAIDFARDHLFERRSVVERPLFLKEALTYSRGTLSLSDLEAALDAREEFLQVDGKLTTQSMLDRESRMIALVNQGMGREAPLNATFPAPAHLNPEQALALQRILQAPDWVIGLRGGAGTGKSTLLKEVVAGIEQHQEALLLAPTSAAVAELRGMGFTRTATVQRYLVDEGFQRESQNRVLVVDESGLLATDDMLALLERAQEHRCRILLSGDTRQHNSVQAGDALRLLEQKSALACVGVHRIIRQVDAEYREAIAAFAAGDGANGLLRLKRLGGIREIADEERYQCLASDYLEAIALGKSALIVSPTWREIAAVTEEIRARLKQTGRLGGGESTILTYRALKWTQAQKRDLRNYRAQQALVFHRATKTVRAGETLVIQRIQGGTLHTTRANGTAVAVTQKQAACYEVATPVELPLAQGDTLLLQGTMKSHRLYNGQLVTVQRLNPDGSIALQDGRTIPAEFRTFTHGYCVTSHASQGRTVDRIFVAVDSHTLQAAHLNQFYVSCSRGREQVRVYTDSRAFLSDVVRRRADRLSATELVEPMAIQPTQRPAARVRAAA